MKNPKKIIFSSFLFVLFLSFIFASIASAAPVGGGAGCPPAGGVGLTNPLKGGCSLYDLIAQVVDEVVLPIGGVIVVFFIIYSGFLMVTSGGNEEKIKVAKRTILYTVIGAAILLGSWVIAQAVKKTIENITAYHISDSQTRLAFQDMKNFKSIL